MKTPPTPSTLKPSFFDDPSLEGREKFWLSDTLKRRLSDICLIEGELFKKSINSEFLKNRYFAMYEDRLVYHNNAKERKEKGWIFLDLLRIEVIRKEEKSGFLLISNRKLEEIYCSNASTFERWHKILRERSVFRDFNSNFTIQKAIGKGSFAIVYQATKNSDHKEYAIKSFDKRKMEANQKNKQGLLTEINIMRNLDHPNIIKLYEVYETENHINLVLELLHGGELFDKILQKGFYTDVDASILMRKLLDALAYMHAKGMMHRDLKPENLILASSGNDTDIKIADFGLSTFVDLEVQLFKRCGTPGYVAPEVLADQPYDQKVDVYSAGLILYILLTGCSPFFGEEYNVILRKNKKGDVSFNFELFEHKPSPSATELLKAMLSKEPKDRITAAEALDHEWFKTTNSHVAVPLNFVKDALIKIQDQKRAPGDRVKRREAAIEEQLVTMSPVITGRTDEIEEEKGSTFMDSPSMRPGGKDQTDIRKMAILKNAQAHAVLGEMAGMTSPQFVPKTPEERGREIKSNPGTPPLRPNEEAKERIVEGGKDKKSVFARNADVSELKNKLKGLDN